MPEPKGWRNARNLKIHSAASLLPLMGRDELRELAEDIEAHGLIEKPICYRADGFLVLLDGRNRLDALEQRHMLRN